MKRATNRMNGRSLRRAAVLASVGLVLGAAVPVQGQPNQRVTGPKSRYWLSAHTSTGFSAQMSGGALSAVMGMLKGGGGAPNRSLQLDLGTVREGVDLSADHTIPGGMNMGASLPLIGVEKTTSRREGERERDIPEPHERSEGNMRMLFFWGCGDNVGADQPVVLDMKQIMDGRVPPNFNSFTINSGPNGPGFGKDKTFVDWPNRRDSQAVPANASLVGDHAVQGPATTDIRFAVQSSHDFMEGLTLQNQSTPTGSLKLNWNSVASAGGYAATAMGMKPTGDKSMDMVLWNSSSKRLLGGERLLGFLPPAEVARLVRETVVMPASQTECSIPKAALEAAGGNMTMLNLNAFGPELNVIHPPRPTDPKVEWNQEYAVKLRLHSSTSTLAGMPGGMPTGRSAGNSNPTGNAGQAPAGDASQRPNLPGALGEGVNLLKGLFGR